MITMDQKKQIATMAIEGRRGHGFVPICNDLLERCLRAVDGLGHGEQIIDAMASVLDGGMRAKGALQMPWGMWVKP